MQNAPKNHPYASKVRKIENKAATSSIRKASIVVVSINIRHLHLSKVNLSISFGIFRVLPVGMGRALHP